MPDWSLSNWQSTIRTCVKIHPDYENIEPWHTRETADLVYADTHGHFTNTLIGCGHLNHEEWHGARPTYYIEVKTTTGPCRTPFYMSRNQFELASDSGEFSRVMANYSQMGRIHRRNDHSMVYMILRVFGLQSDKIGMCVYLDPEQLRQDGRLSFTGQTWSVVPGTGVCTGPVV